jgi:hypothetical protein
VGSGCGSFDGVDNIVKNASTTGLNTRTSVTISAWININGPGLSAPRIVGKGPSGMSSQDYSLILQGTGNPRKAWFFTNSILPNLYSTTMLSNGNWYFIAASYNGAALSIYVNGVLEASINSKIQMNNSGSVLQIGASDNKNDFFNGLIDDVRIYSRALSPAEIQAIYDAAI